MDNIHCYYYKRYETNLSEQITWKNKEQSLIYAVFYIGMFPNILNRIYLGGIYDESKNR
jgi:hypothetical protein